MTWGCRIRAGLGVFGCMFALTGCMTTDKQQLKPTASEMAALITESPMPRLSRGQQPEPLLPSGAKPASPSPVSLTPNTPTPASLAPVGVVLPPVPQPSGVSLGQPGSGTVQASLSTRTPTKVNVRAWVNARPIFDDEVFHTVAPALGGIQSLPEPQRSDKLADVFNKALDSLIEQEVMYQEAVKRLEKGNARGLEKLYEYAEQEVERNIQRMRDAGATDDQIKEISPVAKRLIMRSTISMEYARSRIKPFIDHRTGIEEVREYYDTHVNEFKVVDKVKWQHVFISVGPKHPTLEDAKRFAQSLVTKVKTGDDFKKLTEFDDGDSKFRSGEGFGQRHGEIRPAELEGLLFQMKDGQMGPVVEAPGGVHIFRLEKRDYAGVTPLNDAVQNQIRRKLANQLADREFRRIARELRTRAVVRVEKDAR